MELKEKLQYISKSKKTMFDSCPLSFKYKYLDGLEEAENPYFKVGIDVHSFIDVMFDKVTPLDNGELQGISELTYHPNTPYKKNVVKFEIERWSAIHKAGLDKSFFIPVEKEKKWIVENPKLIGIIDRLHKCFKGDPFAMKHPDFNEGDYVICENKTGIPTKAKCKEYEVDLHWYKIIIEIMHPEFAPLRWGVIYFPFDNSVYHVELKADTCRKLSREIHIVREKIQDNLDTGIWEATPSVKSCTWCSFRSTCPVSAVR